MVDVPPVLLGDNNVVSLLIQLKQSARDAGNDRSFAHRWLTRLLAVELERINFEDDAIDRSRQEYLDALDALKILSQSDDWIHPLISKFTSAYRKTGDLDEIPTVDEHYRVPANGHVGVTLLGRAPAAPGAFLSVSSRFADFVPILESQAGNPLFSKQLEVAFIERIAEQVSKTRVDHLCFVEKEVGPVGALCMMSALVSATRLPACIYREPLWPDRAAISGVRPRPSSKIAIIYDLAVTGAGLSHVADQIFSLTHAETRSAIVSYQYEGCPKELRYNNGRNSMFLESLGTEIGRRGGTPVPELDNTSANQPDLDRPSSTGIASSGSGKESLATVSFIKEPHMTMELLASERPISPEISETFLQSSHGLVAEFASAFAWRAKFPELPESQGPLEGLYQVLRYLVGRIPRSDQLEKVDNTQNGSESSTKEFEILGRLSDALQRLTSDDRDALDLLKERAKKRGLPTHRFFAGLLVDYIESKEILPD